MIIIERAPAKLNLFLHITGKRADGYHLLESLVVFTEFGDRLSFSPAPELSLHLTGEFSAALQHEQAQNLVMRAAHVLRETFGVTAGAMITIEKNIPIAAGLGGGSADAAAALRGLARLWDIKTDDSELRRFAASLGSDVPVCIDSQPAMMRGVGEQLQPIHFDRDLSVLLVNPRVALSTVDVYKTFSAPFSSPMDDANPASYFMQAHNALQEPAIKLLPVIQDYIAALQQSRGCILARMAGSGATCFALFESAMDCSHAAELFRTRYPYAWVMPTALA